MTPTGTSIPPHALVWDLATRAFAARCLQAVTQLGVADALGAEGADIRDLAENLDVDADALGRVLRTLSCHRVFDVELPRVRHNEASLLLRMDHPTSMGAFARMMGLPMAWDALTRLPETIETGRAGIFELDPGGLFSYLREHVDQAEIFDRAMTAKSHADVAAVLAAYDFGAHRRVADIGGGRGLLLDAIASRDADVDATLFEQPEVIARIVDDGGSASGVALVAGDFFSDDLPAADAYVLMEIIHDWDDEDAIRILSNVRRGAPDDAVLLVIEAVPGGGHVPDPATILDIVMLTVTGGRQRTSAEYAALFKASGFELTRVIPTEGSVHIVFGVPSGTAMQEEGDSTAKD